MTRISSKNSRVPPPPTKRPITSNKSASLFSTMAEGMAFGTGSALVREAIQSVFHKPTPSYKPSYCEELRKQLASCMIESNMCEHVLDLYKQQCSE